MFEWYEIYNLPTFEAENLVSKKLELFFEGLGIKQVLLTKGNTVGVTFQGVFLPINLEGNNPYERDGYAVYLDIDNDIWIGIAAL